MKYITCVIFDLNKWNIACEVLSLSSFLSLLVWHTVLKTFFLFPSLSEKHNVGGFVSLCVKYTIDGFFLSLLL